MNLMMWIARSAGLVCARFTALCQRTSKGLASILPTSNLRNAVLTSTYVNVIDSHGTLTARALKGAHSEPLTRRARWVAAVIGILLSMQSTAVGVGSIDRYTNLKSLADYQLTDKQYKCHNEIVHRESSFRANARNGSHHGYYQIRNTKLIDAPYDYQFYFYWKYVQHRYGYTEYDEPDYCKALHHLKTKGWQ
jgi:hypothetical protein